MKLICLSLLIDSSSIVIRRAYAYISVVVSFAGLK